MNRHNCSDKYETRHEAFIQQKHVANEFDQVVVSALCTPENNCPKWMKQHDMIFQLCAEGACRMKGSSAVPGRINFGGDFDVQVFIETQPLPDGRWAYEAIDLPKAMAVIAKFMELDDVVSVVFGCPNLCTVTFQSLYPMDIMLDPETPSGDIFFPDSLEPVDGLVGTVIQAYNARKCTTPFPSTVPWIEAGIHNLYAFLATDPVARCVYRIIRACVVSQDPSGVELVDGNQVPVSVPEATINHVPGVAIAMAAAFGGWVVRMNAANLGEETCPPLILQFQIASCMLQTLRQSFQVTDRQKHYNFELGVIKVGSLRVKKLNNTDELLKQFTAAFFVPVVSFLEFYRTLFTKSQLEQIGIFLTAPRGGYTLMKNCGLSYPMPSPPGKFMEFNELMMTMKTIRMLLCMSVEAMTKDEDALYEDTRSGKYALCTFDNGGDSEIMPAGISQIIEPFSDRLQAWLVNPKMYLDAEMRGRKGAAMIPDVLRELAQEIHDNNA